MNKEEQAKVQAYVWKNYKNFKDKELFITDNDNVYIIKKHKDGPSLFLGKTILEK